MHVKMKQGKRIYYSEHDPHHSAKFVGATTMDAGKTITGKVSIISEKDSTIIWIFSTITGVAKIATDANEPYLLLLSKNLKEGAREASDPSHLSP